MSERTDTPDATLPSPEQLHAMLDFLQQAACLKDTLRSGRTAGGRQESTADHTWRLCLMVLLFEDDLGRADLLHLLKLCLIHDLGEAISGDVPATEQAPDDGRHARERRDMMRLCAPLPAGMTERLMRLWDEYDAGTSPEAVLAKGFDKIETMMQHNIGRNGPGFDYAFNLGYGRARTDRHPLLSAIRAMVDAETRERVRSDPPRTGSSPA